MGSLLSRGSDDSTSRKSSQADDNDGDNTNNASIEIAVTAGKAEEGNSNDSVPRKSFQVDDIESTHGENDDDDDDEKQAEDIESNLGENEEKIGGKNSEAEIHVRGEKQQKEEKVQEEKKEGKITRILIGFAGSILAALVFWAIQCFSTGSCPHQQAPDSTSQARPPALAPSPFPTSEPAFPTSEPAFPTSEPVFSTPPPTTKPLELVLIQHGDDILGDSINGFYNPGSTPLTLEITPDGNHIAIGSPQFTPDSKENGCGYVMTYWYVDRRWKQKGTTLTTPICGGSFGSGLSLTTNGTQLLVSADNAGFSPAEFDQPYGNLTYGNLTYYVFDRADKDWVPKKSYVPARSGGFINDGKLSENGTYIIYKSGGYYETDNKTKFIHAIKMGLKHITMQPSEAELGNVHGRWHIYELSRDAKSIVVGNRLKNIVKVNSFRNGSFYPKGGKISVNALPSSSMHFPSDVAISGDGNKIAVSDRSAYGGRGAVVTLELISEDWVRYGEIVMTGKVHDGRSGEGLGWHVSISDDGSLLSVGIDPESYCEPYGPTRVFKLIGGKWRALKFCDDDNHGGYSICAHNCIVSGNGKRIACSFASEKDSSYHAVRVYTLRNTSDVFLCYDLGVPAVAMNVLSNFDMCETRGLSRVGVPSPIRRLTD